MLVFFNAADNMRLERLHDSAFFRVGGSQTQYPACLDQRLERLATGVSDWLRRLSSNWLISIETGSNFIRSPPCLVVVLAGGMLASWRRAAFNMASRTSSATRAVQRIDDLSVILVVLVAVSTSFVARIATSVWSEATSVVDSSGDALVLRKLYPRQVVESRG